VKSESQVRQKLKQVLFRHRKEFLREQLHRRPENCKHNAVVHLPVHVATRSSLRICGLVHESEGWNNRVCDSLIGGDRQATQCPHYVCQHTPEELKLEFNEKIGLGQTPVEIGRLAKDYPDAAALMWVLSPTPEDAPTVFSLFGEDGPEEDGDG
jgi:hypothetical protein